jgi:hypothetical protein
MNLDERKCMEVAIDNATAIIEEEDTDNRSPTVGSDYTAASGHHVMDAQFW